MTALIVVGGMAWLLAALLAYGLARAAARRDALAPRGGPRVIGRDVYLDPMGEDRRP